MLCYYRMPDETDDQLIYRVCSDKETIGTWSDVTEILNELLEKNYTESAYRKKYQYFCKVLDANREMFSTSAAELEQINTKLRKLEQEKIKYRDERRAWQKQNYEYARISERLDILENELKEISFNKFSTEYQSPYSKLSNDSILIMLTDLHIGACFSNEFGEYNLEIAKNRMQQLLNNVLQIQEIHRCRKCYVSCQGDLINGNIYKSIAITNSENVVEQIKIAAELILNFCNELTKNFEYVEFTNVSGNHSRLDKKNDSLHDERMDDLIGWIVKTTLYENKTFCYNESNADSGIASIYIEGKEYITIHGDYDSFDKNGVNNLCMAIKRIPYAILYGHLHRCSIDEINGVKMVRGGSLCGSGDQYTIEKRLLNTKASQMVCVCGNNGIKCCYPVELD